VFIQFRSTIRKFCEAELQPYADQIDRDNGWAGLRTFWKKLGDMGMLGITAPGDKEGRGWLGGTTWWVDMWWLRVAAKFVAVTHAYDSKVFVIRHGASTWTNA